MIRQRNRHVYGYASTFTTCRHRQFKNTRLSIFLGTITLASIVMSCHVQSAEVVHVGEQIVGGSDGARLSSDGNTVMGTLDFRPENGGISGPPFIWTRQGGLQALGPFPGDSNLKLPASPPTDQPSWAAMGLRKWQPVTRLMKGSRGV